VPGRVHEGRRYPLARTWDTRFAGALDLGTVLLIVATFGTGVVAGLFVAFAVAVMPGLRATDDEVFLSARQRIDVAIVNPLFLLRLHGLTGAGHGLNETPEVPWYDESFIFPV